MEAILINLSDRTITFMESKRVYTLLDSQFNVIKKFAGNSPVKAKEVAKGRKDKCHIPYRTFFEGMGLSFKNIYGKGYILMNPCYITQKNEMQRKEEVIDTNLLIIGKALEIIKNIRNS